MGLGTALRAARQRLGQTQQQVGKALFLSDSVLSDIERGKKRLAPDRRRPAAEHFDDPGLYLAIAEEATGGAMVAPRLDGPRVDHHRCATAAKCAEELREALTALDGARQLADAPGQLGEADRQQLRSTLLELVEAQTAITNTVESVCNTYRISARQLYADHRAELARKGYLAGSASKKNRPV